MLMFTVSKFMCGMSNE
uniref:Uncharacterized protein n=1 Tax=Anguilla anguilla TaxID=7936 RepID=A0A0E9S928_ANGAN